MKTVFVTLVLFLFIKDIGAQNVGVGTVTPPAKLTIQGSNNNPSIPGTSSTGILRISGTENEGIDVGKIIFYPFSGWFQAGSEGAFSNPISLQPLGGNIGIGILAPETSAILDLSSTTQGFLPPRMTAEQISFIQDPVEGLMVYNTSSKKPNYFNGLQWSDFAGNFAFAIGDYYEGGKIAYILQIGDPGYVANVFHGLIAAPTDLSSAATWGCSGQQIPGTFLSSLGAGNQNTNNIVAGPGCATPGIAARICSDFSLSGYADWYLPSLNELQKLQANRLAIGGFGNINYWSSTQIDPNFAYYVAIPSGTSGSNAKFNAYAVRPIRSF